MRKLNILLFFIGIVVFIGVFIISIKQFSHNRTSISISGFELLDNNRYDISGYLELSNNNNILKDRPDKTHNQVNYSTIEMPYIGTFLQDNGKWVFKLSSNIYDKNDKADINILLPRCKINNKYLPPGKEIHENELINNRLEIEDPIKGRIFYLTMFKENERVLVKTKSLIDVALNIRDNEQIDSVFISNTEKLFLRYNHPNKVIHLNKIYQNNPFDEDILKVKKNSWRSSKVLINDKQLDINKSHNYVVWNGWLVNLSGYVDYGIIIATIITLCIGFILFFALILRLIRYEKDIKNVLKIYSIRIFIIYLLFTVISLIFINYLSLNFYERNFLLLYSSIVIGWFIYFVLINTSTENKNFIVNFYEGWSNSENKYKIILFLVFVSIFIAWLFNKGERIGFGEFSIPIVHYTKFVIILFIIIPLKDQIFGSNLRDRNIAHFILWGTAVVLSVITSDFGSLLLTFFAYIIVSIVYANRLIIGRILKLLSATGLIIIILTLFINYKLDSFLAKLYRFILPYGNLESPIFNALSNGHKESYAKIIWSIDDLISNQFHGLYYDYSSVNFYTTFHTDMGFLSLLQFGGIFLGLIIIVLTITLVYNIISYLRILGIFVNRGHASNVKFNNKEINNFIRSKVYIYFIVAYLIVQTIYPILSNLNLLPLTGQAIPGLTVSTIEYIFTPLFVGLMFYFSKVILNKKFSEGDGVNFTLREVLGQNKTSTKVIARQSAFISLLFAILIIGAFAIKVKYFDIKIGDKDNLTFTHVKWMDENTNDVIQSVNNLIQSEGSIPSAELILLEEATKKFHQLKRHDKKVLISRLKQYYFRGISKEYQEKVPRITIDSIQDGGQKYFAYQNEHALRKVSKSKILSNFSFKQKFDYPEYSRIGDENLTFGTKFIYSNGQIQISSKILKNLNQDKIFTTLENVSHEFDYESLTNKLIYKLVNGKETPVYKYEFIGEIVPQSDTYDTDLQAILTAYLLAYKNQADPLNKYLKISSIAIAENSTGNIKALASYPNYANQNVSPDYIQREFGGDSQLKLLGYFDVSNQPQNFGLANAMPGSTIKPITTFASLLTDPNVANDNNIFPRKLPYSIQWSNSTSASKLLAKMHNNQDFQNNLYNFFGFKVFDTLQYGRNVYYPFAPSGNFFFSKIEYEDQIVNKGYLNLPTKQETTNLFRSNAWGQGNIRISLIGNIQNYQRIINRNSQHTLTFFNRPSYTPSEEVPIEKITPLYKGMQLAVSSGTAGAIGRKLDQLGYEKSTFKGKTGTIEVNEEIEKYIDFEGYSPEELKEFNTHSYMILVTPNYTIGITTMGVLPNSNNAKAKYHARGVLTGLLEFLDSWRNGKYLK